VEVPLSESDLEPNLELLNCVAPERLEQLEPLKRLEPSSFDNVLNGLLY
jgi:hypothetical protein